MTEAVAAPPTPVPPTATPNVVATSEAVATAVDAEETAAAAEETAAADANVPAGAGDLPPEITTHLWRLEQYMNPGGEMVSPAEGTAITAEWSNGMIRGETGCNAYNGPYVRQENGTITVQRVSLSPLGMGNLGCESASPEVTQDADYLDALYKGAIYSTEQAGKLQIADAEGSVVLVFATDAQ
jgi:heat shock protein HslJ